MPSLFPSPDHQYTCNDCGQDFGTHENGLPPGMAGAYHRCPRCDSTNITGGPIIHRQPGPDEGQKRY